MNYTVKFLPLKGAMLKYWCVLNGEKILYYYMSRVDAYDKLSELKQLNGVEE
jgi:hypothetical protein